MNIERFFFLFITISNTYPVMEQLIKAGNTKLFYNVYEDIIKQFNVESMKTALKSIEDIVDNNATTSTKALRIPQYINNYLIQKNADIKDYKHWINIYELTQLSKEQFEEVVNSFQFACVNSQVSSYTLGNILKYGYDFNKLLRYIIKQSPENDYDVPKVASTLYDYLSMCEILGVEPDKFPQNLKKQHDDIMVQFTNKKNEKQNAYICRLAEECEKWFASYDNSKNVPKEYNNYVVVFPKNINDFIEEGNKMHNCVGNYVQRVYEETCIIFFLRKKDFPEESFITGECKTNGMGQFYLSNNRYVEDLALQDLGKYICKKLCRGVASGKIEAFKKLDLN